MLFCPSDLRRKHGKGSKPTWAGCTRHGYLTEWGGEHRTFAHLAEKTSPNMHSSSSRTAAEIWRQVIQVRSLEDHETGSGRNAGPKLA